MKIHLEKKLVLFFLDISKAFDKVWHTGLLFKLKQCGLSSKLLNWVGNYLHNRQHSTLVRGTCSSWLSFNCGVPQGCFGSPVVLSLYK